jgi:hypothetical protein
MDEQTARLAGVSSNQTLKLILPILAAAGRFRLRAVGVG